MSTAVGKQIESYLMCIIPSDASALSGMNIQDRGESIAREPDNFCDCVWYANRKDHIRGHIGRSSEYSFSFFRGLSGPATYQQAAIKHSATIEYMRHVVKLVGNPAGAVAGERVVIPIHPLRARAENIVARGFTFYAATRDTLKLSLTNDSAIYAGGCKAKSQRLSYHRPKTSRCFCMYRWTDRGEGMALQK